MHCWHTPPFSGGTGAIHPCKLHYIGREYLVGGELRDTRGLREGSLATWLFRDLRQLFETETGKSVWIFHLNPEFLHASQLVDVFSKAFMSFYALPLQSPQMPHCWPMLRRSPPSPPLMPLLSKGPRKQGQMWLGFSVVAGIVVFLKG